MNYAGHSSHCECKESAIQWEREYANAVRKIALLERVVRAARSHAHSNDDDCSICIYLRELNGQI